MENMTNIARPPVDIVRDLEARVAGARELLAHADTELAEEVEVALAGVQAELTDAIEETRAV